MRQRRHEEVVLTLAAKCQAWGGSLEMISEAAFRQLFGKERRWPYWDVEPEFTPSPAVDWHGCHYGNKTIYTVGSHESVNGIIHEMGHVFASLEVPDRCEEIQFLGWEMALAIEVGGYKAWSKGNGDYGIAPSEDWNEMSAVRRSAVVRERLRDARMTGLVVHGRAVSIRRAT